MTKKVKEFSIFDKLNKNQQIIKKKTFIDNNDTRE